MQQIIAQELEVERLRRASILTGLGGVNAESMTNSKKSEVIENVQKKSVDNAKSRKNDAVKTMSLKEVVSASVCFLANVIKNIEINSDVIILIIAGIQGFLWKYYHEQK